jgi:hypothetical protein
LHDQRGFSLEAVAWCGVSELPIEIQHPEVGRLIFQPVTVVFTTEPNCLMRILVPMSEADTIAKLQLLMEETEL